jgi:hypothetical protein
MKDEEQPTPKPQPKWSGRPPRPPQKTARDLLGDSGEPIQYAPDSLAMRMQSVVTHAYFNLGQLQSGGRTWRPRIRESLETILDEDVILLSRHVGQLVGEVQKLAIDCLRLIRDYRRGNPRSGASDSEQAKQAQKILDEL